MPECEWCGENHLTRRRVPNPGWVRLAPGKYRNRAVLFVCFRCRPILEGAAREAGG